jgi:hypothetical protein
VGVKQGVAETHSERTDAAGLWARGDQAPGLPGTTFAEHRPLVLMRGILTNQDNVVTLCVTSSPSGDNYSGEWWWGAEDESRAYEHQSPHLNTVQRVEVTPVLYPRVTCFHCLWGPQPEE